MTPAGKEAHREVHFEDHIVHYLGEHGWLVGDAADYDRRRALYPEDVIGWLKDTQPDAWATLESQNGAKTETAVLDRLVRELEQRGTLEVLRHGMKMAGAGTLVMSQARPEDDRNETIIARHRANRLRVVRQLKYAPDRDWSLDLGLFVNGMPVATVELKSDFTQGIKEAVEQYKHDRKPKDAGTGRSHPLLTFKRGALVHFAVSTSEIQMTTQLKGAKTYFLPFNMGFEGGKGNPPVSDGRYAVAYFWERILEPSNWLRILHRFVMVEEKIKEHADGRPYKSETMIFPRFHQWEAVTKLIDTVREEGPGHRYLIQHSAGSGKTNSISWSCHELIRLRRPDGEKYFDTVIVVTDRTVLDQQLQDAIRQIDHQHGVVSAIDREASSLPKSQQLAEALLNRTPIVIVTLQTFPYAMEAILGETTLKDRRFAVIIDEAHTSQTGASAGKLKAVLSMEADEDLAELTAEDILARLQEVRKFPENVSYLAFTATPKHSTLTLFGRPPDPTQPAGEDNLPEPFHVYSMQQAIEEGFILDVLRGYTSYQTAFKLAQAMEKDDRVDGKQANRALARWLALHPTNVAQKVEFIVEHFRGNVEALLGGQAKAMIVTPSRAAAVSYKLGFDRHIAEKGYTGLQALVAFSGKVPGGQVDKSLSGQEFDEINMNPGLGGQDLRTAFDRNDYAVMIVANKFQTGFDQPKLVAMYLDKKISGVEAVQTLSRLNRTYAGKDRTFVIDFANDPAEILAAFHQFYRKAEVEAVQDPNIVYDIKAKLDEAGVCFPRDVERYAEEVHNLIARGERPENVQPRLMALTDPATDRFNGKLKDLNDVIAHWEEAERRRREQGDTTGADQAEMQRSEHAKERDRLMGFKTNLSTFVRMYEYIAQVVPFGDPELEAFAGYARLLRNRLEGVTPEEIDLAGLQLTHYALKRKGELHGVDATAKEEDDAALRPVTGAGTGDPRDRERAFLSEIIERINDLLGSDLGERDNILFAIQISERVRENEIVMAQVRNNTSEQAMRGDLPGAVSDAIVEALAGGSERSERLLSDSQAMTQFIETMLLLLTNQSHLSDYPSRLLEAIQAKQANNR